jgi:hypothetical protein
MVMSDGGFARVIAEVSGERSLFSKVIGVLAIAEGTRGAIALLKQNEWLGNYALSCSSL